VVVFELDVSRYLREKGLSDGGFANEVDQQGEWWFHRFDFSNGVSTRGRDPSANKLHALSLPPRLDGLSVIDIGAADGYFSFQCEARGAARVVASDEWLWLSPGPPHCLDKFRFVKRVLSSSVEERIISVEALSAESVGVFDIALFLGVLYHAPNMMHYLERLRAVTKTMAVIETFVDLLDVDQPAAAFYPPGTVNNDSSNWWGPNISCVDEMLLRAGFTSTRFVALWETNTLRVQHGESPHGRLKSGRAVWHAFV